MTDLSHSNDMELRDLDLSASAVGPEDQKPEPISNVVTLSKAPKKAPQVSGFDYSGLSAAVAKEAEATASRIRERLRTHMIDSGRELLNIKTKLGHGKFGKWLEFHFGWKERTAQNYMNSVTAFGSTPQVIDLLPPSTVYKLAARSTPIALRQSVIDGIERGETPDPKQIEKKIAETKIEARQRRNATESVQAADKGMPPEIVELNAVLSLHAAPTIDLQANAPGEGDGTPLSAADLNELRAKMVVHQLKEQFGTDFGQLRSDILNTDFETLKKALQEG